MDETRHALPSSDGFEVAAWSASTGKGALGTVVLCHGLTTGADDEGPFLPLRDSLLRRGFGVVRFDARCHGETGGTWRDLSLRGWRDDVGAAIGLARTMPGERLTLLAASFGSGPAIAAIANGVPECAGIVLWNPVLDYERTYLSADFPYGAEVLGTAGRSGLPDWAGAELPIAGVPLSHELIAEMRSDPTPSLAGRLPCPGVVIHGTHDPFVDIGLSRTVTASSARLTLRAIPMARHGFRGLRPLTRAYSVSWLQSAASGRRHWL